MFTISTTKQQNNQATDNLSDDVVVSVKNVSKKFCKHLRRSMAYGIADLYKNLLGVKSNSTELRKNEFWAVNDVSFEVRKGEILGLIGPNGSGKSTLLRLLTGIFPPDKGEIIVNGKVGALIAIGAGFHPHMTGRENIYLNGTVLCMTRDEINLKFNDIVDFAEIRDFLDAPVSAYSSGMRVRLGFSIAAHTEPDVMLIDEVLSVGDAFFQYRCLERIKTLKDAGTSMIFVSHNMHSIALICDSAILILNGQSKSKMATSDAVDMYKKFTRERSVFKMDSFKIKENESGAKKNIIRLRSGLRERLEIVSFRVLNASGSPCHRFALNEIVTIEIVIQALADTPLAGAAFLIRDAMGVNLIGNTSHHNNINMDLKLGQNIRFSFKFQNLLRPAVYSICIASNWLPKPGAYSAAIAEDQIDNACKFESIPTRGYHVWTRIYLPVDCKIDEIKQFQSIPESNIEVSK
ncbi:MAG: ABC transporter ATP-binding protein [Desulfobacula sp.]|nr:ABC transporter ATP-binding protein [Desulfobacula sp.]